jgi:hypothetical protein
MGTSYNPPIVTDGLVFCVDAANQRSYPKSGTTWSDLVGSNDGTMQNMTVSNFSPDNGGSLIFDGSDDYVEMNPLDITGFNSISVFQIARKNISNTLRSVSINHSNNDDIAIYWGAGDSLVRIDDGTAYDINFPAAALEFMFVGLVFDGSVLSCYKNGTKIGSVSASFNFSTASGSLRIGSHASGAANFFNGRILQTSIYNRDLSADEVRRNYEATAGRFT